MTTEKPAETTPAKKAGYLGKSLAAVALGVAGVSAAFLGYETYQQHQAREIGVTMTSQENAAFMKGDQCVVTSLSRSFDEAAVNYIENEGRKDALTPLTLQGADCAEKVTEPAKGTRPYKVTVSVEPNTYKEFRGIFREAFDSKHELVDLVAALFLFAGLNDEFEKAMQDAQAQAQAKPAAIAPKKGPSASS